MHFKKILRLLEPANSSINHLVTMLQCYNGLKTYFYSGLREEQDVLVTHGYGITELGPDLKIVAEAEDVIQGFISYYTLHYVW